MFPWNPASTYIQEPPFLSDVAAEPPPMQPIRGARVLLALGDSVTTDHISPAGSIAASSPAGKYLIEHGVRAERFQQLRLTARKRSGDGPRDVRQHPHPQPARPRDGRRRDAALARRSSDAVYDAAMQYQAEEVPLVVLAGAEYGTGSSRDWAAKGTLLLGVRAVLAASFERIHRSNLVGMGICPWNSRRRNLAIAGPHGRGAFRPPRPELDRASRRDDDSRHGGRRCAA